MRQFPSLPRSIVAACAGLCLVASLMPAAALADTAAHDIEARIQYSYFTEDGRALDQLAATLAPEGADPTAGYLRGFAEYRRAQLRATTDGSGARQAGDACVRHADLATRADAKAAEPLVLHAACAALVAQVARVTAPLAGGNSLKRLGRAQRLQPRNPRVMFLAAQLERPRVLDRATRARSIERLRAALEAFEGERRQAVRVPSWGAADAYLALGQLLLESGDAVAAREAIERALLLAPEFAQARRVAARIGAGGE